MDRKAKTIFFSLDEIETKEQQQKTVVRVVVVDDIQLLIILFFHFCRFFFKISTYVVKHHSKVENDF
jgi:hypothetical protein